ncbi:hypothetical protein D5R93_11195 [Actinomyces lilanjuaniae]|uniref:Uncharacterized protein n=1 Tax=Actinomyces lilanjuaniae TaxID=2321394 RepID=A0ABN5PTI6_9ACTO|nr:hypothetical protein D5R93_11195 [Actinomyces lilanjuaniae]
MAWQGTRAAPLPGPTHLGERVAGDRGAVVRARDQCTVMAVAPVASARTAVGASGAAATVTRTVPLTSRSGSQWRQ